MTTLNRGRPGDSERWTDSEGFHINPTLQQGVFGWLAAEWEKEMKEKGIGSTDKKGLRLPTITEIMIGI